MYPAVAAHRVRRPRPPARYSRQRTTIGNGNRGGRHHTLQVCAIRSSDCGDESRTRGGRASRPRSAGPTRRPGSSSNSASGGRVQRLRVVHDAAHVEVDVVRHLPRGAGVAGDLDDRRDRIAGRRAEPGREHHDLRPAADHAGDRLDVEARRIHHRQALCGGSARRSRRRPRAAPARPPCASRPATSPRSSSGRRGCCRATAACRGCRARARAPPSRRA